MKIRKLIKLKDCLSCRQCCYFAVGDEDYAPLFTSVERKKISPKLKRNVWQECKEAANLRRVKLVKSKNNPRILACPFLDERKYRCLIEEQKPLDCLLWPFVLMQDQRGKKINLCVFNKKFCPSLGKINQRQFNHYKNYLEKIFSQKNQKQLPIWFFDSDARPFFEIEALTKR